MRALAALGMVVLLGACDVVRAPDGSPEGSGLVHTVSAGAANAQAAADGRVPFVVPNPADIPDGPMGAAIRRGRALAEHTRDSLPSFVGNGLRCASCHLDAGTRRNAMPWVGVYARFPQYRSRSGRVIDLEERIGDCFERSLNGRSPAYDSREMRDMIAYMAWLSHGTPVGRETEGQGIPALAPVPPDTVAGRRTFVAECARCHGMDGQGHVVEPATPLWGPRSYNVGAGMTRLRTAAAFIRAAMPWDRPNTLTPQQAYDVAAYVNSHQRPDLKGKENDWPNGDPPPDVAYPTLGRRP